jgi:hypothetical protein
MLKSIELSSVLGFNAVCLARFIDFSEVEFDSLQFMKKNVIIAIYV